MHRAIYKPYTSSHNYNLLCVLSVTTNMKTARLCKFTTTKRAWQDALISKSKNALMYFDGLFMKMYLKKKKKGWTSKHHRWSLLCGVLLNLPGEAALIVVGQELMVPRWYIHVSILITKHTHFKPIGLLVSSWICLGIMGQLLAEK